VAGRSGSTRFSNSSISKHERWEVQYPRLSSLAFLAWVAAVIFSRGAVFIVLSKSATGFVCWRLTFAWPARRSQTIRSINLIKHS
jgi:hypothetical protein